MSIEGLRNLIHQEVQRFLDRRTRKMPCVVDGYRGDLHAVKVKFLPSGTLSGWVLIETDQIGNLVAPNIGDPGWIDFHEDDARAPVFVGANHNDENPPSQAIAAGERLMKLKSGQSVYFKKDGSITQTDKAGSTIVTDGAGNITLTPASGTVTVNGNLAVTETFNVHNTGGVERPCNVTGDIALTGMLAATGDVIGAGHSLSNHIHVAPNGDTGPAVG